MKEIKNLFLTIVAIFLSVFIFNVDTQTNNINNSNNSKKSLSEKFINQTEYGVFNNQVFKVPSFLENNPKILGDQIYSQEDLLNPPKRIYIDLSKQRLYAFEGSQKIYDFLVSTGKWNKTPTGVYQIWIKLRYKTMTGGSEAAGTYYYLPNVPFTMFFANDQHPQWEGYGIHGTYWHDNFGHPMSHGCINMKNEDIEKIYYWANPVLTGNTESIQTSSNNPGTQVIIYGETPEE